MAEREVVDPDWKLAEAMASAVLGWNEWCHRRQDSYIPVEQDRGQVQHSVDCTPMRDPSFALNPELRSAQEIPSEAQALVPLAIVRKGVLREFEAFDRSGAGVPVLTREQNIDLSAGLLAVLLLRVEGLVVDPEQLMECLFAVVGDEPGAVNAARELVEQGSYRQHRIIDHELLQQTAQIPELIRNLGAGFLLVAVVPYRDLGSRGIIRVSYLWDFKFVGRKAMTFLKGHRSIQLPMTAASDSQAYHLEVRLPANVRCLGLSIPGSIQVAQAPDGAPRTVIQPDHEIGKSTDSTLHLRASYLIPPYRSEAWLELVGSRRDTFWAAILGGIFIGVVGVLLTFFSGSLSSDQADALGDSTTALTLSVPAVFFGYISTQQDHLLGQPLTLVYRLVLLVYAGILMSMAGASMFVASAPILRTIWAAGAGLGFLILACLLLRLRAGFWHRIIRRIWFGADAPALSAEDRWRLQL